MLSKEIKDKSNEEILRQQLELLAEYSQKAEVDELGVLTTLMVKIYESLKPIS